MGEESVEISPFPFQMISVGKSKILEFISSTLTSPFEILQRDRRWLHTNGSSDSRLYSKLSEYTLEEVSYHDTPFDCWVVVYDVVYDITSFLQEHPGGDEIIMEYAGRDATLAFKGVGHSRDAEDSLKKYRVGVLIQEERLWSRFHTVRNNNEEAEK